jgi:3-oxoacyl-[acyl-carrier-protein] synthase II
MASQRRRSVFTGIGLLTPIGLGAEAYWQALRAGKSGVRSIQAFDASALPIRIAGEVCDFDAKNYVDKKDRKSLKVMARAIQMGVAGSAMALKHAGIDPAKLDPTRFGVDFGAGLIASELDELAPAATASTNGTPGRVDMARWGQIGLTQMPPLWMLKYLPNMSACHVSIMYNAQGPNNTITENEVAPLLAMSEAHRIISRGQADVMLCGGADSKVNPLSLARLSLFSPLSQRNDAPEKASRPFERHRDGLVPGEGAGIMVLEELAHAQKRGAIIFGEVVGTGAAFDLRRNGDGLARAITAALQEADIRPEDIDHINAQGFSTRREDTWEARGLHKVFGKCRPAVPVFAGKSYFGSLGPAGAGIELAASLLALRDGMLPPTLNYDEPDPECPITVLAGQPRNVERGFVLKVSFTEVGQCAALVVRGWGERT